MKAIVCTLVECWLYQFSCLLLHCVGQLLVLSLSINCVITEQWIQPSEQFINVNYKMTTIALLQVMKSLYSEFVNVSQPCST